MYVFCKDYRQSDKQNCSWTNFRWCLIIAVQLTDLKRLGPADSPAVSIPVTAALAVNGWTSMSLWDLRHLSKEL
jgi:hypothetical protein